MLPPPYCVTGPRWVNRKSTSGMALVVIICHKHKNDVKYGICVNKDVFVYRGFETSRDYTMGRLIGYRNKALDLNRIRYPLLAMWRRWVFDKNAWNMQCWQWIGWLKYENPYNQIKPDIYFLPTRKSTSTECVKLHRICNTFQFTSRNFHFKQSSPHPWPVVHVSVNVR